ncbi:MAG TPA: helix-turn-helix domain-containing protein [Candidatus Limnocylindria bacterium]|nr:helix-turn-helix domain-containing protein [Candidatus Limnocylindria bacterium]
MSLLNGKWKSALLCYLLSGTKRFGELRRLVPEVSARILTAQLRELENDGLLVRRIYAEVPPKVEYTLTPLGRSLESVLDALRAWGTAHLALFDGEDADVEEQGHLAEVLT